MLNLYDYFRSSAAYRVRIVLHLKQIPHELHEVHLVNNGGEQHHADYQTINPQQLVPSLVDGELSLSQSLAIIDYLEAKYPNPTVYPGDLIAQSKIKAIAFSISCDIHPLNNLRVLQYLTNELGVSDEQKTQWYHHWLHLGFNALEKQISNQGPYCFGKEISLADICLIPQVYNAHRFALDMTNYPNIERVNQACLAIPAFANCAP